MREGRRSISGGLVSRMEGLFGARRGQVVESKERKGPPVSMRNGNVGVTPGRVQEGSLRRVSGGVERGGLRKSSTVGDVTEVGRRLL